MRPRDRVEAQRIDAALTAHHNTVRPLPGIQPPANRAAFLEQFFESVHRVRYIARGVLARDIAPGRADPSSDLFDPVKGAALKARQADHDEACWLVFYFAHFGKNLNTGYRLARDVYGALGHGPAWTWQQTSADPESFRRWLTTHQATLRGDIPPRHFGNHRKYVSKHPTDPGGTGEAFVSYVRWVLAHGSHRALFDAAAAPGHSRRDTFRTLYRSMAAVASFGRTARFDYLTMLAKLGLADIEPGSTHMTGATGPLAGADLLFGTDRTTATPRQLDRWLVELEAALGVEMGMQVLEDSLCNWQKSPAAFVPFRG
jgi:hypothetical protein